MTEKDSSESEEFREFKKHMRSIRNSDYLGALGLIKTDLGLPERVSDSEIEALLIYATREKFKESLDADIVLSAFGLLKGFDNQHSSDETHDSNALVTARRRKFIRESSYVADRHGPHNTKRKVHYNSYSELEAAGEYAIEAVISALGSEDGNLINKVAQGLYSYKSKISSYLKESKRYLDVDEGGHIIGVKLQDLIHVNKDKKLSGEDSTGEQKGGRPCEGSQEPSTPHTKPIESSEEETQFEIILPESSYTLKNFPPADQLKSNPEPQPEPQPGPRPEQYNLRKQLNVAIATIVVLVIILCCIVGCVIYSRYRSSSEQNDLPSVEKIILSREVITVKPGIPEKLKPGVIPNEAGIGGLECEPENKNLVRVEKRVEDFRVIVNDGWQEETDYTTTIKVYVKDDTDVYTKATVIVEPPAHISDPPPSDIDNPVLDGSIGKNENSSWNDYTE